MMQNCPPTTCLGINAQLDIVNIYVLQGYPHKEFPEILWQRRCLTIMPEVRRSIDRFWVNCRTSPIGHCLFIYLINGPETTVLSRLRPWYQYIVLNTVTRLHLSTTSALHIWLVHTAMNKWRTLDTYFNSRDERSRVKWTGIVDVNTGKVRSLSHGSGTGMYLE